MKGIIASLAGLFVMACSGCGGGEESAAPAPRPMQEVLVDAYGDSTMWGYDPEINAKSPTNAPAVMQDKLRNEYKLNVTVTNHGVSGSTLKKLIEGTDGMHEPWEKQAKLSNARYVIMNFGLNDVLDGIGESPDEYRELLSKFVGYARQAGKIPVFDEPSPTCDPLRINLRQYISIMRDVAKTQNVHVITQHDEIFFYIENWRSYFKDCVHPNGWIYTGKGSKMAHDMAKLIAQ